MRRDGLAVLQIPGGIEWNPGQRVRLVVGIAARSDGHIAILKRLTGLIQDEARLRQLAATHDPQDIIAALTAAAPKTAAAAEPATDLEHSLEWIVSYPSGLHARRPRPGRRPHRPAACRYGCGTARTAPTRAVWSTCCSWA
ncbi:PTS sugar transporter subunit IIA [Achromobacter xylosoxidans]